MYRVNVTVNFMKKLFLSGLILIVLGAGVFSFSFMSKASAGDPSSAKESELKKNFEYVELSPLVLPIIGQAGISQTLSLVVSIEVNTVSDAEKIEKIAPKLQDAYIQDMYGVLSSEANLAQGGTIQVKDLKKRLTDVSKTVAGDMVNDVLLQVVSQRPI